MRAARLDGILGLKGVIEIVEEESEDARKAAEAGIVAGFDAALAALPRCVGTRARRSEAILAARLDEIAALDARADARRGGSRRNQARHARADRGAAGGRTIRSGSAASGSGPARHQGRYP